MKSRALGDSPAVAPTVAVVGLVGREEVDDDDSSLVGAVLATARPLRSIVSVVAAAVVCTKSSK